MLAPYFECCYLQLISVCEECSKSVSFNSLHSEGADLWYLAQATAMKKQNWVIPEKQITYCDTSSMRLGIKHDPKAYSIKYLITVSGMISEA